MYHPRSMFMTEGRIFPDYQPGLEIRELTPVEEADQQHDLGLGQTVVGSAMASLAIGGAVHEIATMDAMSAPGVATVGSLVLTAVVGLKLISNGFKNTRKSKDFRRKMISSHLETTPLEPSSPYPRLRLVKDDDFDEV